MLQSILKSDKVAKEMFRILKPKGKFIIEGTDIEKGSKSFELTKSMGLEKAITPIFLQLMVFMRWVF